MGDIADSFVSRAWLGPIPVVVWALVVALTGGQVTVTSNPHAGFFLYLAAALALMTVYIWTVSRADIEPTKWAVAMRHLALLQGAVGLASAASLAALGHPGSALLAIGLTTAFLAGSWPWGWALRRWEQERTRAYRGEYFFSSLLAGAFLIILASFSILDPVLGPEPTGVSARMLPSDLALAGVMLAAGVGMLVQAWDERRRPGQGWTPASRSAQPR